MKNYSEMTDFEINRAVGDASGVEWAGLDSNYHPLSIWSDGELCVFCPCKSWADAGPIIERYRITIMPASQGENWMAQAFEYALTDVSTTPLRSAMIVFLMMRERENDK